MQSDTRTDVKKCSKCRQDFPLEKFNKNRSSPDGLQYYCRDCHREAYQAYRNSPDHARRALKWRIRHEFGIDLHDYDQLRADQEERCAICGVGEPGNSNRFWCVDHDHVSGRVRGLLCTRCNPGLGFFRDDPELLLKAVQYLRRHQVEQPRQPE